MLSEILKEEKKKKEKKNTNTAFQETVSLHKSSVKAARIKVILLKYFLIQDLAIANNSNKQNGVLI